MPGFFIPNGGGLFSVWWGQYAFVRGLCCFWGPRLRFGGIDFGGVDIFLLLEAMFDFFARGGGFFHGGSVFFG